LPERLTGLIFGGLFLVIGLTFVVAFTLFSDKLG